MVLGNSLKRTADQEHDEPARKSLKISPSASEPPSGTAKNHSAERQPTGNASTLSEPLGMLKLLETQIEELKRRIEALEVDFRVMGPRPVRLRADSGVGASSD